MANFKELLSGVSLTEEAKTSIQEAWDTQITEAKKEVSAQLREEFSQKFEHDKSVLVESLDNFLRDKISAEITEFAEDKKALIAERVKYKTQVKEHAKLLNTFIAKQLSAEISEFRSDKVKMKENMEQLENFLVDKLSEEIKDFRKDKQALVEQRVKLVTEGKKHLEESKNKFISKAATLIESKINSILNNEIRQYRADIIAARENDFGRRIFESYAAEFMTSYLNEGSEVKKLSKGVQEANDKMAQLQEALAEQKKLTESTKTELKVAKDLAERNRVMNDLCAPLGKEKRKVMEELLSSVHTHKLVESFKKYLHAVLNESAPSIKSRSLNESIITEVTGDKTQKLTTQGDNSLDVELEQIRILSGIQSR